MTIARRRVVRRIERMTAIERRIHQAHEDRVRSLGCILCHLLGRPHVDATIHHCRYPVGMGQRASAAYAIPLARPLHQLGHMPPEWPWQDDVPIEAGQRPFRARYGLWEHELLAATYSRLRAEYPSCETEIHAMEQLTRRTP